MNLVAVELAVGRSAEMVLDVARALDVVGRGRAALELVEDDVVRLAHDLGEHVQPAAMRHAEHDLLHAELAAALDDLLERRDQRLGAVEAEALGAGILDVEEPLETLGLGELVEDRLLALTREGDALVRALDPLLDPALLGRVGDVHELDGERAAIGPPQDLEHLGNGREFEPEDVVDEDLSPVVGLGETIGGRVEVVFRFRRLEAERVEIGVEMAAHAVGADHHDRADRVPRRLLDARVADLGAARGRRLPDLLAEGALDRPPIAVEGGDQFAIGDQRPVLAPPGRAGLPSPVRLLLQPLEERPPLGVDRGWVAGITRLQLLEIGGIGAVEKRSLRERGI